MTPLHDALRAAFLPECQAVVQIGLLTGTTAEAMAEEFAAAVVAVKGRVPDRLENVVYAGAIDVCEAREYERRGRGGDGYSGNGHHWAQRLVGLAAESAAVREAFGDKAEKEML